MEGSRLAFRIGACLMLVVAIAWVMEIRRQSLAADDGGPAIGALCMSVPAIMFLIGAGAAWSASNRR